MKNSTIILFIFSFACAFSASVSLEGEQSSYLERIKKESATQSKYLSKTSYLDSKLPLKADLNGFEKVISPILTSNCVECHGPEKQKAKFRVDTLDPNLLYGEDLSWWLEVMDVVSNGEMPPEEDVRMEETDRSKVVDWLSSQVQISSQLARAEKGASSFRRMTKYEYNYSLQDLLGLQLNFAKDLPSDPLSSDGFKNSSDLLQMSAIQYSTYLELNRKALRRATVRSKRPQVLYWSVSSETAFKRKSEEIERADQRARNRAKRRGNKGAYYQNLSSSKTIPATWSWWGGLEAWAPTTDLPEIPNPSDYFTVIPAGQQLVIELGNRLPDKGIMQVRVRASRVSTKPDQVPTLALEFGWQGDQDWKASSRISPVDLVIDASPGKSRFYQFDIPLSEITTRNPVRSTKDFPRKMSDRMATNPSEYIRLHNTSFSKAGVIHLDYVEVTAPIHEQWPPASHTRIFFANDQEGNEITYAREIVSRFMTKAWRRTVTDKEVDFQMEYFARIRPICQDFQQAVIETLSAVLSSPRFLYLVHSNPSPYEDKAHRPLDPFELATRLSMFLWCSIPDDELIHLAANGRLKDTNELVKQTKRMLADPRHKRFTKHFVRQWLGLGQLDFLKVDNDSYPDYDSKLKESMAQEPIAFFEEMLRNNHSVMDFLHADYALVNQRLAEHYGIPGVHGHTFQKVSLKPIYNRGGLLTQAGLLAMNSDGEDSNPLKRGIWLLESILNDPPPPPPPTVPEIDLADPEILKMTLKERMEDHRKKSACFSCHVKIDPWGVAFENFDAIGSWRTKSNGKEIDSTSYLFNLHQLDGVDGVKRYLLANRQDQFVRALVHKMTTFALGRPLTFADHSEIDRLTAGVRQEGDGLRTLVSLLVTSELFNSK